MLGGDSAADTTEKRAGEEGFGKDAGDEVGQAWLGKFLSWMRPSFCSPVFSNSSHCLISYPVHPLKSMMTISKYLLFFVIFPSIQFNKRLPSSIPNPGTMLRIGI